MSAGVIVTVFVDASVCERVRVCGCEHGCVCVSVRVAVSVGKVCAKAAQGTRIVRIPNTLMSMSTYCAKGTDVQTHVKCPPALHRV